MTPKIFNALNYTEKTEAVLKAVFLADRLSEQTYVKLYSLDNFYVEVFFDDCTHLITHFHAFAQTRFIMSYLDELKIAV